MLITPDFCSHAMHPGAALASVQLSPLPSPLPPCLQGTLEMLQLGGGNDLSGTLPACLFDQKSALYFLGASSPGGMGGPRLTGTLPDAFPAGSHLQMLDVVAVSPHGRRVHAGGALQAGKPCSLTHES